MQPDESGPVVLMATGSEALDGALTGRKEWRPGGQVLYREAVGEKSARVRATVVVLACSLPGGTELAEVIYGLRRRDIRVILLAGDRENADRRLLSRAVGLGVYDLLFDPVRPEDVARAVLQPAGFAGVAAWLAGGVEPAHPAPAIPGPAATPGPTFWRRRRRMDGVGEAVGGKAADRVAEADAAYRTPPEGPESPAAAAVGDGPPVETKHGPGRVVAFASPAEGVGRSFLAVAFGIWLAGLREEVVVLELDGGGARAGTGWCPSGRGTGGFPLLSHPSGLRMVRVDRRVNNVGHEKAAGLVDRLTAYFPTVIVTLPAAAGEGTPDFLGRAAPLFLVATPDRAVLYDIQCEFYLYRRLGLDPAQVKLVLNRRGRRSSLRVGEVGGLVPCALCTIVPESGATPEEAFGERRFRRSLADLGRAAGYPAGRAGGWNRAGQGKPVPPDS